MNKNSKLYKELDEKELVNIIENYFGKNSKFDAKLISGGLFNTTYYINITSSNKEIILRVGPVNKHLVLPFEENLMKSEEYVYKLCNENNIPCSNILLCDTDKKIINRDYMIVEYIKSKPLSEIKVSDETKNNLYEELGKYASTLHSIKSNQFGRAYDVLSGNGFDLWSDFLLSEIINIEYKAKKFNIFEYDDINSFKLLINKYKNIIDEVKVPYLIHGDLWAGNILVKEDNENYYVCAIIDADRAIFGDIDLEMASPWIINEHFIKGYNKELSNDEKSLIRKNIYKLLLLLIDTYVWIIEYDNLEYGIENKNNYIKLMNETFNYSIIKE